MGIQSGSITLCRYKVLGHTQGLGLKTLSQHLEPYIRRTVDLGGIGKEEQSGWVRPLGIDKLDLAPDAHWDMSDAQLGDGFLMRMRTEKRKVPASLLAAVLKQKLAEEMARSDQKLTRKTKAAIKEQTQKELMARALPTLGFVDAFWRPATGDLTLFAGGKAAKIQFEALFADTFGKPLDLDLLPIEPPLLGMGSKSWQDAGDTANLIARLSVAVPVSFAEAAYP